VLRSGFRNNGKGVKGRLFRWINQYRDAGMQGCRDARYKIQEEIFEIAGGIVFIWPSNSSISPNKTLDG